jgi:para-aminobenzoate synthetase component 1
VEAPYAIVRAGNGWLECRDVSDAVVASGAGAFAALDRVAAGGFWVGFCSYDLGRAIEHVDGRAATDVTLPDVAFVRYETRRPVVLPAAVPVELGGGTSSLAADEHAAAVDTIQALLRAGECYQVNLTRRIAFGATVDPRALFAAVASANPAPHASMGTFGGILPGVAWVSASPELFLRVRGQTVESRPIKGTAPDAASLRSSAKDRAENVMIVDLARNDLGRVCEYGSIEVPELCAIERHPGLHHMVSTVRGRLRDGVSLGGLVRATFPPASVTGAPKPRVLQAIEDLEPVRRGLYCGAVGWVDADAARAELAVAIRTFTLAEGRVYFGTGGGIVADSRADAEWEETRLKAARLLHAVGAHETEPVGAR